ncbi:hypothetical protein T265_10241 [Opisthorchis viverrini]|uniref:PDZ domain-containing protein n=1 Tax=Opisthorchis viverrini TaxID=6198 RepID=A0A074Z344_OPIVI|nr:hypothetical protein T265_10241 [Opisthorchis viverrini]KER21423.1 hypothetical protein T265_10241 [Opisthorchis viverrini]
MTETIQRNSYFFCPTPPTHPPSHSRSSGMQPRMGTKVGHDVLSDRSNDEWESSVPSPSFKMNAPKKVRRSSVNGTTRLERIVDWPQFRFRRKPTIPSGTKLSTPNILAPSSRQPVKAIHMNRLETGNESSSVPVVTKQSHAASIPSSTSSFGAVHDDKPMNVITPVRIATNPHVRRRYSAEEGFSDPKRPALRREPPDYTSNNEGISRPSHASLKMIFKKSQYICIKGTTNKVAENSSGRDGSFLQPINYSLHSSAAVRNPVSKPSLSTTSTEQVISQPSNEPISRTKYRAGRYSAEAVLRSHKSYPALMTQSPREKRRSSFFLEIKRSARDTLNSLRKAFRGSTHSLQEAVELDHSVSINVKERVEDGQGFSGRSSLFCDKYFSQPLMNHDQAVLRNVTLSREDSSQPFGLYVVKSDQVRNPVSKPSLSTTSTEQVISQPSNEPISRTKYRAGRYSAEAVLRSHKSYPALMTQSPREKRRSSFFLEIKRSARDTLNSLRKAFRGSTHSLQEAVELDHSVSINVKERVEDDQGFSGRSSLFCDKYFSQPLMNHDQAILRNVTLSREDSSQPFGLYVVKSDQGFQITRLSEQVCTSPQKVLSCGDELVRVNGLDCKSLSTEAIRQLFHQCQSLSLTVKTVRK